MQRHAFSLVELSIVLVILGLLTGGILAGQSLIRAAELRSITTEASKYQTAVMTFKDKYFALPGDMTNAIQFWGAAHATPATCKDTASTDARTCNGDGDGGIDESTASYEEMRFWQHLANASLIEGSYNGVGSGGGSSYAGAAPTSKGNKSAFWVPWFYGVQAPNSDTVSFGGNWGNTMELYQEGSAYYVARPDEIWNIDTKLDDGMPGTGKMMANKGDATYPCTTRANQLTDAGAQYNLSHTGKSCYMAFANWF